MKPTIAKVFMSGNSQAIRLPKEFRLDVSEVFIVKSGNRLIVTPHTGTWKGFIKGFSGLSDDFSVSEGVSIDPPRKTME